MIQDQDVLAEWCAIGTSAQILEVLDQPGRPVVLGEVICGTNVLLQYGEHISSHSGAAMYLGALCRECPNYPATNPDRDYHQRYYAVLTRRFPYPPECTRQT
jgi:hypothetical protein